MYKHILIPVALEHKSAVDRPLAVARALLAEGGRVSLLTVLESAPSYVAQHLPDGVQEKNRNEATQELSALVRDQAGAVEPIIAWGHAGQTILKQAETIGADLIVIASHQPGLEDYFLGSTAARVVRHARCAVHVIR